MTPQTAAILNLADQLIKGGRQALIADLLDELAPRKFYATKDLAERYSVSVDCIKKWRENGTLTPSLRIENGTVRYSLADLQKFEEKYGKEAKRK